MKTIVRILRTERSDSLRVQLVTTERGDSLRVQYVTTERGDSLRVKVSSREGRESQSHDQQRGVREARKRVNSTIAACEK